MYTADTHTHWVREREMLCCHCIMYLKYNKSYYKNSVVVFSYSVAKLNRLESSFAFAHLLLPHIHTHTPYIYRFIWAAHSLRVCVYVYVYIRSALAKCFCWWWWWCCRRRCCSVIMSDTLKFHFTFVVIKHYARILEKIRRIYVLRLLRVYGLVFVSYDASKERQRENWDKAIKKYKNALRLCSSYLVLSFSFQLPFGLSIFLFLLRLCCRRHRRVFILCKTFFFFFVFSLFHLFACER